MKKIRYYEILGVEPHTFVGRVIGHNVTFDSKLKAIDVLEDALSKWKKSSVFASAGVFVDEVVCEDSIPFSYIHEFVFKGKVRGLYFVAKYEIVHRVLYLCDD